MIDLESYRPRMMSFALGRTKTREEAEDCVQDSMVKAFSGQDRLINRAPESVNVWLFEILNRTIMDSRRTASRRPVTVSMHPASDDEKEFLNRDNWSGIDEAGAADEIPMETEAAIRRYAGDGVRAKMVRLLMDGYTPEETAKALGVYDRSTIYRWITRMQERITGAKYPPP